MLGKIRVGRPSPGTVLGALALIVATSGVAVAAIPSSGGLVSTCFSKAQGTWRPIDADTGTQCKSGEVALAVYSKSGADAAFVDKTAFAQAESDRLATDAQLGARITSLTTDFAPVPQRLTSLDSGVTQQTAKLADLSTTLRDNLGAEAEATAALNQELTAELALMNEDIADLFSSETGEMESLRLQMAMDRLSTLMSTLSNMLTTISDTSQTITQNIK